MIAFIQNLINAYQRRKKRNQLQIEYQSIIPDEFVIVGKYVLFKCVPHRSTHCEYCKLPVDNMVRYTTEWQGILRRNGYLFRTDENTQIDIDESDKSKIKLL